MLPIRRSLSSVRLRSRRRHHHPRRRHALWPHAVRPAGHRRPSGHLRRPARSPRVLAAVLAAVVGAVTVGLAPPATGAPPAPRRDAGQPAPDGGYVPPVDAPIVDPFRPPAGPYGPGNRGLEYATVPGTPVRASAAGTVVFAGQVGGALHVTVLHADQVRTSYSFLAAVDVVQGVEVGRGERIGTAGTRLHFGARTGDAYFDPAALFAGTVTEVELLPFEIPPGSTPDAEARALVEIALAEGGGLSAPNLAEAYDWLRGASDVLLPAGGRVGPAGLGLEVAGDVAARLLSTAPCSTGPPPARPVGDQPRRAAVTVAGLGSSSTSGSIDELRLDDLGYAADRVVRFSYVAGRTPTSGAAFAAIDAADYTSLDTQGDVVAAGGRLADLIEQVATADPEAVVDVYAHSLGGVVTRLALTQLADRGFDLGRLGVVTTLGSPHGGADVATAVTAATGRWPADLALDVAERILHTGLDPGAPAVAQLAEGSDVVARLDAEGVPPGVRLLSLAARGDVVVAAPHTEVAGAANVTVPVAGRAAHSDLVGSDAATAEVARALAGQPPGCESWDDVLADVLGGHAIATVEDHLGRMAVGRG